MELPVGIQGPNIGKKGVLPQKYFEPLNPTLAQILGKKVFCLSEIF